MVAALRLVSNSRGLEIVDKHDRDKTREIDRLIRLCVRHYLRSWPQRRIGILDENDLVHVVWLKLLTNEHAHILSFVAKEEKFANFIWQFTKNRLGEEARKCLRRLGREGLMREQERADAFDEVMGPEELLIAHQLRLCVSRCLVPQLTDNERAVFDLRFRRGLSNQETARALDITSQAVANRVMRIREKARGYLLDCEQHRHW